MASGRSPASILFDSEGNPIVVDSEGHHFTVTVSAPHVEALLRNILQELKLIRVGIAEQMDFDDLDHGDTEL